MAAFGPAFCQLWPGKAGSQREKSTKTAAERLAKGGNKRCHRVIGSPALKCGHHPPRNSIKATCIIALA
jgi:hypothetical protein